MKKVVLFFFLLAGFSQSFGQSNYLDGLVIDTSAHPIPFATISLLYPEDSTLAYFAVTNEEGNYHIANIKNGKYFLLASMLGFQNFRRTLEIPLDKNRVDIRLHSKSTLLKEAEISDERIPVLFKKDTIEYDGSAYRVKPDGDAEDLLKKLPGIEVDKSGNVKAQGEEVKNVLVDGKEFFGSDPKVATRNIPSDAVKKVQVFDQKSEEAQLTNLNEGKGDKTINLVLKDDKKKAWFGEVQGGYGSDDHFQSSAKAFRFTNSVHLAFLGMANNINQYGFSFKDYMHFNGGFGAMMNGDGNVKITLEDDGSTPINFGQTQNGEILSGAGGANFAYEKKKDHRFSLSYLGNGIDKNLTEDIERTYGLENTDYSFSNNTLSKSRNLAHRLTMNWKNKIDSTQTLLASGNISMTDGKQSSNYNSASFRNAEYFNTSLGNSNEKKNGIKGSSHLAYMKSFSTGLKLLKLYGDISGSYNTGKLDYFNSANYLGDSLTIGNSSLQKNTGGNLNISSGVNSIFRLGGNYFGEIGTLVGSERYLWKRNDFEDEISDLLIDSLSSNLVASYRYVRPSLVFRYSTEKVHWEINMRSEYSSFGNDIEGANNFQSEQWYFLPEVSWENEYAKGRRLRICFESTLDLPSAGQLDSIPVTNVSTQTFSGNRNLKPQQVNSFFMNWFTFDQFSFTSYMATFNFSYTKNKIQYSRTTDALFNQSYALENVPYDYTFRLSGEFSTPIRKAGLMFELSGSEKWNRGVCTINSGLAEYNSYLHSASITFNNRKKKKLDASMGATLTLGQSYFGEKKELNTSFSSAEYFSDLIFTPTDSWNFTANFTYSIYNANQFNSRIEVPLLRAGLSYLFLKGNRASISLDAFDIFNQNSGVERTAQFNYIEQKTSNTIGRYFLLTLKFRLSKFDSKDNVDVKLVR